MKTFGLLPSSPDIRDMNKAQLLFCYMNIVKDEEEQEEMWKSRLKYLGMLTNPHWTLKMEEFETGKNYSPSSNNTNQQYVNSDFDKELQNALQDSNFFELPDENNTRGNANMSSDDFINLCMQGFAEDEEEDLDIIEIDE